MNRSETLEGRGQKLRRRREFRKAANAYGELTSIDPGCARWWVLRADCLQRSGRSVEALKAYRQAAYLFHRTRFFGRERALARPMNDLLPLVPSAA